MILVLSSLTFPRTLGGVGSEDGENPTDQGTQPLDEKSIPQVPRVHSVSGVKAVTLHCAL